MQFLEHNESDVVNRDELLLFTLDLAVNSARYQQQGFVESLKPPVPKEAVNIAKTELIILISYLIERETEHQVSV